MRAISDAHGGDVLLDSVAGRGATFTIVIPVNLGTRWHAPDRRRRAANRLVRRKGLSANGFAVTSVNDGPSAYDYAMTGDFDLMILDIGLPGMDGFTVMRKLRAEGSAIPVIVLTARDSVQDTVAGLEGGADDYMPKPFRFEELLARVRLRLTSARTTELTVLSYGGLHLDLRTRRARVGDETVDLSAREFALVETFLRHPGQVLSREQVLSHVLGLRLDPGSMWSTSTSGTCDATRCRAVRHVARHGLSARGRSLNGSAAGRDQSSLRSSSPYQSSSKSTKFLGR